MGEKAKLLGSSSEGENAQGWSLRGGEIDSSAKGVPRNLVSDAVLGSGDERSIALMFAVDILSESHDPVGGDTRRGSVLSQREQKSKTILGSIFQ
jgi:hypothetical protein